MKRKSILALVLSTIVMILLVVMDIFIIKDITTPLAKVDTHEIELVVPDVDKEQIEKEDNQTKTENTDKNKTDTNINKNSNSNTNNNSGSNTNNNSNSTNNTNANTEKEKTAEEILEENYPDSLPEIETN